MDASQLPQRMDSILRLPKVLEVTGLSKSTLYRMARDGDFPRPVRIASQLVGWRASLIQKWIESREEVGSPTSASQGEQQNGEREAASPGEDGR